MRSRSQRGGSCRRGGPRRRGHRSTEGSGPAFQTTVQPFRISRSKQSCRHTLLQLTIPAANHCKPVLHVASAAAMRTARKHCWSNETTGSELAFCFTAQACCALETDKQPSAEPEHHWIPPVGQGSSYSLTCRHRFTTCTSTRNLMSDSSLDSRAFRAAIRGRAVLTERHKA